MDVAVQPHVPPIEPKTNLPLSLNTPVHPLSTDACRAPEHHGSSLTPPTMIHHTHHTCLHCWCTTCHQLFTATTHKRFQTVACRLHSALTIVHTPRWQHACSMSLQLLAPTATATDVNFNSMPLRCLRYHSHLLHSEPARQDLKQTQLHLWLLSFTCSPVKDGIT